MSDDRIDRASQALVEFSEYINSQQRNDSALTIIRLAKIGEQAGEVLGDFIRADGRNILKEDGEVEIDEVADRVLSVAFCALAAYEHLMGHDGSALPDLLDLTSDMQNKVAYLKGGV